MVFSYLLNKYADQAYNDVARNSRFYGQQVGGYLYSPFIFRRFAAPRAEKFMSQWYHSDKKLSVSDFVTGKYKVCESTAFKCTNTDELLDILKGLIESDKPVLEIVSTLEGEALDAFLYQCCVAAGFDDNWLESFVASGMSDNSILDLIGIQSPSDPHECLSYGLSKIRTSFKRIRKNQSLSAGFVFKGSYVLEDGKLACVMETKKHGIHFKYLREEIRTLDMLERTGNIAFEERKNFLPLSFISKLYGEEYKSYKEAAKITCDAKDVSDECVKQWRFLYTKAGIFYAVRNRIAFEGCVYKGLSGQLALDKAAEDVLALEDGQLEEYVTELYEGALVCAGEGIAEHSSAFV